MTSETSSTQVNSTVGGALASLRQASCTAQQLPSALSRMPNGELLQPGKLPPLAAQVTNLGQLGATGQRLFAAQPERPYRTKLDGNGARCRAHAEEAIRVYLFAEEQGLTMAQRLEALKRVLEAEETKLGGQLREAEAQEATTQQQLSAAQKAFARRTTSKPGRWPRLSDLFNPVAKAMNLSELVLLWNNSETAAYYADLLRGAADILRQASLYTQAQAARLPQLGERVRVAQVLLAERRREGEQRAASGGRDIAEHVPLDEVVQYLLTTVSGVHTAALEAALRSTDGQALAEALRAAAEGLVRERGLISLEQAINAVNTQEHKREGDYYSIVAANAYQLAGDAGPEALAAETAREFVAHLRPDAGAPGFGPGSTMEAGYAAANQLLWLRVLDELEVTEIVPYREAKKQLEAVVHYNPYCLEELSAPVAVPPDPADEPAARPEVYQESEHSNGHATMAGVVVDLS